MAQAHSVHNPFTEEEITTGLMAMVAWAGNASAASRYLKSEKKLEVGAHTLSAWKRTHAQRYMEMRDKFSSQMEEDLAHEMRDVARLAVEAERLAIEQAVKNLEAGDDRDPGRTAANLSRVAQSSTDKLMSLTGRPKEITEQRGLQEIVRGLVARGFLQLPAAPTEEEEGAVKDAERAA